MNQSPPAQFPFPRSLAFPALGVLLAVPAAAQSYPAAPYLAATARPGLSSGNGLEISGGGEQFASPRTLSIADVGTSDGDGILGSFISRSGAAPAVGVVSLSRQDAAERTFEFRLQLSHLITAPQPPGSSSIQFESSYVVDLAIPGLAPGANRTLLLVPDLALLGLPAGSVGGGMAMPFRWSIDIGDDGLVELTSTGAGGLAAALPIHVSSSTLPIRVSLSSMFSGAAGIAPRVQLTVEANRLVVAELPAWAATCLPPLEFRGVPSPANGWDVSITAPCGNQACGPVWLFAQLGSPSALPVPLAVMPGCDLGLDPLQAVLLPPGVSLPGETVFGLRIPPMLLPGTASLQAFAFSAAGVLSSPVSRLRGVSP